MFIQLHLWLKGLMKFENTIIYLFGFPGTGKYTIAKEIVKQANFVLVDNHLINNPVFSVIGPDGKKKLPDEVWENCKKIWHVVWDSIHMIAPPSLNYVLTNQLTEQTIRDRAWFFEIAGHTEKRGSRFLPVRLLCSEEELRRRIVMPDRAQRLKMTDPDGVSRYCQEDEVLKPDYPALMELDVTDIPASEAAKIILERAKG